MDIHLLKKISFLISTSVKNRVCISVGLFLDPDISLIFVYPYGIPLSVTRHCVIDYIYSWISLGIKNDIWGPIFFGFSWNCFNWTMLWHGATGLHWGSHLKLTIILIMEMLSAFYCLSFIRSHRKNVLRVSIPGRIICLSSQESISHSFHEAVGPDHWEDKRLYWSILTIP